MTTPSPSTPSTPQPPVEPALPPPKPKFTHGGARTPRPKHKFIVLRLRSSILEQFPSPPVSAPATVGTSTPKKEKENGDEETPRTTTTKKRPADESNPDSKKKTSNGVNGTANGTKKRKLDSSPTRSSTPQPQPQPPPAITAPDPLPASTRPWTQPPTAATHRLGPKGNTGAINACLRALDRSGSTISRNWTRAPFRVKSFTGFAFGCGSWEAPKQMLLRNSDAERQRERDERENVNPVGSGASLSEEKKEEVKVEGEGETEERERGEDGEGEGDGDGEMDGDLDAVGDVRMSSPVVAEPVGA